MHIVFDMNNNLNRLPNLRALIAFEHVARLGGVTRAATELRTSQAAVSRHLKHLELELGAALVTRSGRGIVLTTQGQAYFDAISPALMVIRHAGDRVRSGQDELVIACTHEVSHLLLMPRFRELQAAVGKTTRIRFLTCEYDVVAAMVDAGADMIFEHASGRPTGKCAPILSEEIIPAAAPAFIGKNEQAFSQSPGRWQNVKRLALSKNNYGWATWEDWFASQTVEVPDAQIETFDNYVYALEAAARGDGLVLAWRGFADSYLASGALVPVTADWLTGAPKLYARLTERGEANKHALQCLKFFSAELWTEAASTISADGA